MRVLHSLVDVHVNTVTTLCVHKEPVQRGVRYEEPAKEGYLDFYDLLVLKYKSGKFWCEIQAQ